MPSWHAKGLHLYIYLVSLTLHELTFLVFWYNGDITVPYKQANFFTCYSRKGGERQMYTPVFLQNKERHKYLHSS